MNNNSAANIKSYEDLIAERERLKLIIAQQKNIIRHDIDNLKHELKQELKPAVEAANFVKKFTSRDTRNNTYLQLATNTVIDVIIRRIFNKSGFLLQLIVPGLLKNFSANTLSGILRRFSVKKQQPLSKTQSNGVGADHYHG